MHQKGQRICPAKLLIKLTLELPLPQSQTNQNLKITDKRDKPKKDYFKHKLLFDKKQNSRTTQTKPDIIVCTETWLKPEISLDNLDYAVFCDDCLTGKGGGTLLAISKCLTAEEQPNLKMDVILPGPK